MDTQNLLKTITDLVAFETVYPHETEFSNCVEYIKNYFGSCNLHIEAFEYNQSKSLVISTHVGLNFDVIFCGHIDVVSAPQALFTVKQDGDILFGRGVADMKGQVAIMMQLMRQLAQDKTDKKVALFLTSDEERGGFDGVNRLLGDLGYSGNVAIVPDGGFDYALVAEAKGVLHIKITTRGVGCHSSEPWKGENAIIKLFDIFNRALAKFPNPKDHLDWKTSFNLSKIEGGDSVNKVPSSASMFVDIRHVYGDKAECIIDFIQNIDNSIHVEVFAQGQAFNVDADNIYVAKYIDVCRSAISKDITMIKCHSASDGRFFAHKNIPCLIMNPIGGNIHGDDEWVSLSSLITLKAIYEQYLREVI